MSTPPSKRLRTKEARADEPDSSREHVDSDPAGRLLHRLRDKSTSSAPPPAAALEPGARVRVLRGPLAGKSGVVQELDGRGGARVMLGLLSTRIDLKDLATTSEGGPATRMTLSSSHRKPR